MGAFVANMTELRENTGAHVLIVHHGTKSSDGRPPRGHSSLTGAVDTIIEVIKVDGGDRRASIVAASASASIAWAARVAWLGVRPKRQPAKRPSSQRARYSLASMLPAS